jgi:hypothetical protein
MLGALGGGAALGYPQPLGGVAVCHAQGLHMKQFQGIDLSTGTALSSNLYVFAINKACGDGPFETIGYNPDSGQWLDDLVDPVPTAMLGPHDGGQMDMINTGNYTFSVKNAGIRGVAEPLSLSFTVEGVLTGGLVFQRITDLGTGTGSTVPLLFDDPTVPNMDECSDATGGHPDDIPIGTPHNALGSLLGPSSDLVAWRDGGLLLQGGEGRAQAPNITNLALFNLIPGDDNTSRAHWGLAGCSHVNTLQNTPWRDLNDHFDPSGDSRAVRQMDPSGRFGTHYGRVIGVGPGEDVIVYADGLLNARGIDVYPPFVPGASGLAVFFRIDSPVDVLITAADGRRLGVDPATGLFVNDYGDAGYDSNTDEPHIYGIRDPMPGDFIIETKGTGDGPYHITTYGLNLATHEVRQASFTGTAAPGSESNHGFALDENGVVTSDDDTAPPNLTVPVDITVESTGPEGATVTFAASANDDVDGPVDAACDGGSGATFPLGPTTVECSATDSSGNIGFASFTITVVDTTPPQITAPANMTVEGNTTGSATGVALGTATATDAVDPSPTVTNDAPPFFPLGNTVVTWTATDASSNFASATQVVTVVDTTPPEITVPANITVEATSADGAMVNYGVTASDIVDSDPEVSCQPASGSTFPNGETVVQCIATDSSGTEATGSFTVTVLEPTTIDNVIAAVNAAGADGTLKGDGPGRSASGRLGAWRNMLDAARNALDAGNVAGACNLLQQAYLRANGDSTPPDFVTGAAREELAQMVLNLREFLGCS